MTTPYYNHFLFIPLLAAQVLLLASHSEAFSPPQLPARLPNPNILRSTATRSEESSTLAYELICGDVAWNTLIGEADRSLRLGIELERSGQARAASAALHEAATLYQCFLDSEEDFAHVTALLTEDCPAVLAYLCIRLGFLNLDALGDANAAVRLYREASTIDPVPSPFSYEGYAVALEASGGGENMKAALEEYQKANTMDPSLKKTQFNMAVVLDRLGRADEAEPLFEQIRRSESHISCKLDSWGYVRWHTRKRPDEDLNLQRGTYDMLKVALQAAMPLIKNGGLVLEFGVGSGRSIRMTQELLPLDVSIHGFDTFTGLPQAWGNEPRGAYSTGGVIPKIEGKVFFHQGLFCDTIGPFLEESDYVDPDAVLAYANIDCDLYSSTLDILEGMAQRIVPGTILIFDEYICHPSWRQDEFRAWRECCKRFGWKYEYLAFSLNTKQTVVRVLEA